MRMPGSARITLDSARSIGKISPLLFGGFVEHMGRGVYGGIYDPGSPLADAEGFRRDVADAIRELGITVIRYPGGNYLSGHHWIDGVGPRGLRPTRRDLAWRSLESNMIGTDEFMRFCRLVGGQPMLGVNLGTGTIEEAGGLVEYVNGAPGSYFADMRVANGSVDAYHVPYWCLGNEMDGPWQIGHLEMHEYGRKASEAAKVMRLHDPSITTILCGSSNTSLPTYPEWDRVALEACWEQVDYLAMHYYASNESGDTASYLGLAAQFESHIDTLAGTLRYVKSKQRSQHDVYLSWDEWNVWYRNKVMDGRWEHAPHLLEEVYNLEDALVVAQWLNVFLRRCDVLQIACLAQLVNVIAPIMTTTDAMLKQTIFYPLMLMARYARGRSLAVSTQAPMVESGSFGDLPALDVSACHDPDTGAMGVFIVNRSLTDTLPTEIVWQDSVPSEVLVAYRVTGSDVQASNTFERPDTITAHEVPCGRIDDGKLLLVIPPLSFTVVSAR